MPKLVSLLPLAAFIIGAPASAQVRPDFAQYPARVLKVHAPPQLKSADHRAYQTTLRKGAAQGVNFAGYMTLVDVACGLGCVTGWVIDRRTGRITDLPLDGEELPFMRYATKATSRLLKVEWAISEYNQLAKGCMRADFMWDGRGFRPLGPRRKSRCEIDPERSG